MFSVYYQSMDFFLTEHKDTVVGKNAVKQVASHDPERSHEHCIGEVEVDIEARVHQCAGQNHQIEGGKLDSPDDKVAESVTCQIEAE